MSVQKFLSAALFALTTLLGTLAFLYPFWLPTLERGSGDMAHAGDSALMLSALVAICLAVLLVEVQSQAVSAKAIALMGVLVAMNAVLRFAEVAIPGPGGFSPIFLLIILGGYVFGARMGFLLGALTLLASALVTGGVGPWLPYQMLTAGWVGMSAPLCRPVARRMAQWSGLRSARVETIVLAVFAGFWGPAFGAIMNIWFWPYAVGAPDQYWQPGIGVVETVQRYAAFYVVTSLLWDLLRAAGNVLLIVVAGEAVLRILRRFQMRFDFDYSPAPETAGAPLRPGPVSLPAPAPAGGDL